MIKNSGELIALACTTTLVPVSMYIFIVDSAIGGGKYQQYKCLKWHNPVVSLLLALYTGRASTEVLYIYYL